MLYLNFIQLPTEIYITNAHDSKGRVHGHISPELRARVALRYLLEN